MKRKISKIIGKASTNLFFGIILFSPAPAFAANEKLAYVDVAKILTGTKRQKIRTPSFRIQARKRKRRETPSFRIYGS